MIEAFGYVFFEDKEDFDSRVKFNDFRQTYVIENTCEFESYPPSFPAAYKRKACSSTLRYRAVDFVEAYADFADALMDYFKKEFEKLSDVRDMKNTFTNGN